MTVLFFDSFDHYATADITKKWNSHAGGGSINASGGRRGGGAFNAIGGTGNITKNITAGASFVIGCAVHVSASTGSSRTLFNLLDAGTTQCDLRLNPDLTLSVTRNGTALTGGTSTNAISAGSYYFIEWKVTIADSIGAGSCEVYVNGVNWITVATGQDTKNTANASANQVTLGLNGAVTNTFLFDDFYIVSGTTLLGDCRAELTLPNGDGTYSQFTPSTGTTHYTLVDESTPNTTDYNDGSTVGDRDSYTMGNLAALTSQTVYAVQVCAAIQKDDAGSKSASTFVRSGSTNSDGSSVALSTSQAYICQVYETDPNTSSAWTESSVNAMEAGVRVTA